MFTRLLNQFISRSNAQPKSTVDAIVHHVAGRLPTGRIPENQVLCIFQENRLVNYYRDENPPERQAEESWWLLPDDDIGLTLSLAVGSQACSIQLKVRFEASPELFSLLNLEQWLTHEHLVALVTSKLAGLVDMIGSPGEAPLLNSDPNAQERLRAQLSLLLQCHGLRCTAFGDWIIEPEALAEDANTEELDSEQSTEQLVTAIENVTQEDDWDELLATFDASGYDFDEQASRELGNLGQQVLRKELSTVEVASRLTALAQEARQEAQISQPELHRWQGMELRLRTGFQEASSNTTTSPDESRNQQLQFTPKRRPGTWWILNRRKIDNRLLTFLLQAISDIRHDFDNYRSHNSFTEGLVHLRRIDQRLAMALDLINTVPTLSPPQPSLRIDRTKIKSLVRHVEAAITAIETIQAEIELLQEQTAGNDAWIQSCETICIALDHLNDHLQQRRKVRSVVGT